MKGNEPGPGASREEWMTFIHDCMDRNFASARWKSWLQLVGLAGVILTLISMTGVALERAATVVQWTDHVDIQFADLRLSAAALKTAVDSHTGRLNTMASNIGELNGIARGNSIKIAELQRLAKKNSAMLSGASRTARGTER